MPISGPSTTSPARVRPTWLRQNSTTTKPSWASKGTSESPEMSSTSGSDAKSETPPRRVSKVTITPKVNGQKKDVDAKLQSGEVKVPVTTPRKPSIPNAMFRLAEKPKKPPPSSDTSRSSSLASSEKSRSTTPATKKVTPIPVKKEKSPSPESEELDSSEYEEVTVTETESEEEIERPVTFVPLRKVSKPENVVKEKSESPEPEFLRPALKKVDRKPEVETKERRASSPEPKFVKPQLRKVRRDPSKKEFPKEKLPSVELKKTPKQERELRREPTIPSIQEIKQENVKKSKSTFLSIPRKKASSMLILHLLIERRLKILENMLFLTCQNLTQFTKKIMVK